MRAAARAKLRHQHAAAFLLLSYLILPSVSMIQFRGLDCVSFEESGHAYLRIDTSVWCDKESDEYSQLIAITVPLIILYQSIPIGWALLLWRNRRRLNPGFYSERASRRKRARDPALMPFSRRVRCLAGAARWPTSRL